MLERALQVLKVLKKTLWQSVTLAWYDGQTRTLASPLFRCAGCWCVIRQASMTLLPYSARMTSAMSTGLWSDLAIARTTPFLLGLFSWVTLLTEQFHQEGISLSGRQSAWYPKARPTFADALALVRYHLWQQRETFLMPQPEPDMIKIPRSYLDIITDAACYAA
jgi:hypothetical protein